MQLRKSIIALTATLAVVAAAASPANAAHWGHGGGGHHGGGGGGWHHGGGGGWHGGGGGWHRGGWGGAAAGFATGALIGAAAASPYYGDPYNAYGYGPDVVYDDDGYGAAPGYGGGRDDAYCAQRFRSYDPSSGTYLGYDGARHPCP